jgi:uncharacterized protein (DUF1499 family)
MFFKQLFLLFFPWALMYCAAPLPPDSSVGKGRISPCPSSPNCVSSLADKEDGHYIAPLNMSATPRNWQALKETVSALPRTRVVTDSAGYMHVTFTSLVWRFVDDVEFLQADTLIHVRSASRLGRSDLGVNRRRVEKIRRLLHQAK